LYTEESIGKAVCTILQIFEKRKLHNFFLLVKQMFSMFGGAYLNHQTFSTLNFNKNKQPSVTDEQLENILKKF